MGRLGAGKVIYICTVITYMYIEEKISGGQPETNISLWGKQFSFSSDSENPGGEAPKSAKSISRQLLGGKVGRAVGEGRGSG